MSKDTQHAALQRYLDALLNDTQPRQALEPEEAQAPSVEQPVPQPIVESELAHVRPLELAEAAQIKFNLAPLALREPLISEAAIQLLPKSAAVLDPQDNQQLKCKTTSSNRPELQKVSWAEDAFECLLFDVAGLTLAVPLVALGSIYALESGALTPLFGQPDWFIGILPTAQGHLKVLETARWVMPERYTEGMRSDLKYVISINGFDWGLAVNHVHHVIGLAPDQVKWRTERSKRAWLAGTVIEQRCALLDVKVLAQLMTGQDAAPGSAQAEFDPQ